MRVRLCAKRRCLREWGNWSCQQKALVDPLCLRLQLEWSPVPNPSIFAQLAVKGFVFASGKGTALGNRHVNVAKGEHLNHHTLQQVVYKLFQSSSNSLPSDCWKCQELEHISSSVRFAVQFKIFFALRGLEKHSAISPARRGIIL